MANCSHILNILHTDWKFCELCYLYIFKKDFKFHQKFHVQNMQFQNLYSLPHGFIKDNSLHLVVSILKETICIPIAIQPVVFMHPATMKILGLRMGDLVLLTNVTTSGIFYVWVNRNISQAHISFPKKQSITFKKGDNLFPYSFSKIFKVAKIAKEIHFSPSQFKNFMQTEEFLFSMHNKYKNIFIHPKGTLMLEYMGTYCKLEITSIATLLDEIFKNSLLEFHPHICDLEMQNILSVTKNFKTKKNTNHTIICSSPISAETFSRNAVNSFEILSSDFNIEIECDIKVQSCFTISSKTNIVIEESLEQSKIRKPLFNHIGGLQKQIKIIKTVLKPFLFSGCIIGKQNTPKRIILFGPSGTGKSFVTRAIINESQVPVIYIDGLKIFFRYETSPLTNLRKLFAFAHQRAPCLMIIDELHTLYPRNKPSDQLTFDEKTVLEEFPRLIGDLHNRVAVIASTSFSECLDSSLICHGRFEKEIRFNIPIGNQRKEILEKLLCDENHNLSNMQIESIANSLHGFTGADLLRIYQEAKKQLKLRLKKFDREVKVCETSSLIYSDFINGIRNVKPSMKREFFIEIPKIYWSNIGGMFEIKQEIIDMIDMPLKYPKAFDALGIKPSRGILMYGPPGCSKTMIAKAIATESQLNFISIKGPELFNKYVGESENAIHNLFKKARSSTPCIMFFDEIDSLATERGNACSGSNVEERVLTQLLTEMDGIDVKKGIHIIAATNRPDLIDSALLRPGRFDRILYIPLPDKLTRKEILQIKLKDVPFSEDIDFDYIIEKTEGYTGAEIIAVCNEAAMIASLQNIKMALTSFITMEHFKRALAFIKPRTSKGLLYLYNEFKLQFSKFILTV